MPNFRGANALFTNLLNYKLDERSRQAEENRRAQRQIGIETRGVERDIAREGRRATREDLVFEKTTKRGLGVIEARGEADIALQEVRDANVLRKSTQAAEEEVFQAGLFANNIQQRADRNNITVNIPQGANFESLKIIDSNLDQAITNKRITSAPDFLPTSVFTEADDKLVRKYGVFLDEFELDFTPENIYNKLPPDIKAQWDSDREQFINIARQTGVVSQEIKPIQFGPGPVGPQQESKIPPVGSRLVGVKRDTEIPVYITPEGNYWSPR